MTPASAWRVVAAIVIGVLVVAGTGAGVRAEADGPDFYSVQRVTAGKVLNIRAAPSAKSAAIGQVPHDGRGLRNLGCQGGPTLAEWERMSAAERDRAARKRWCRIRYRGVEGWVAGWFLAEDSGPPPPD